MCMNISSEKFNVVYLECISVVYSFVVFSVFIMSVLGTPNFLVEHHFPIYTWNFLRLLLLTCTQTSLSVSTSLRTHSFVRTSEPYTSRVHVYTDEHTHGQIFYFPSSLTLRTRVPLLLTLL